MSAFRRPNGQLLDRRGSEYRYAPIDAEGDLGIAAAPEERHRAAVWVDQGDFLGGELKTCVGSAEVTDVPSKEGECRRRRSNAGTTQHQETEFEGVMDVRKHERFVFEMKK